MVRPGEHVSSIILHESEWSDIWPEREMLADECEILTMHGGIEKVSLEVQQVSIFCLLHKCAATF